MDIEMYPIREFKKLRNSLINKAYIESITCEVTKILKIYSEESFLVQVIKGKMLVIAMVANPSPFLMQAE